MMVHGGRTQQTEHCVLFPQGSAAGKKYKFVVTGHGKYEKIPVDDENEGEFTNGKSGKTTDTQCW